MQKLIVLFSLVIAFTFPKNSTAQDFQNNDSLLAIWKNPKQSSINRLKSLEKSVKGYYLTTNLDSARILTTQMRDFAKKKKNDLYQGIAYNILGEIEARTGDSDASIPLFKKGLKFGRKTKDITLTSGCLNNIGLVNEWQGNFLVAIDYYKESLKVNMADSVKNAKFIAKTNMNIGNLFYDLKNFDKSLHYLQKAEQILINSPDDQTGTKDLTLAHIWIFYGNIHMIKGTPEHSMDYFVRSKETFEKWGDEWSLPAAYIGIADVHRTFKRMEEAMKYYFLALEIDEKYGEDKESMAATLVNICAGYFDLQDYKNAKIYALRCIKLADEIKILSPKIAALEVMIEVYKYEKDYPAAINMLEELLELKETMAGAKVQDQVLEMETKYVYEKKAYLDSLQTVRDSEEVSLKHKEDLAEKENQKRLAYWGGGMVLIIAFIFGLSYYQKRRRNNELKEKNKIIEDALDEKGILLREISHRVKNNMQMISGLLHLKARNTEDPKVKDALMDSRSRVDSMGLIHQKMYQNDIYDTIDITEYSRDIVRVLVDCSTHPQWYDYSINGNNILINLEKGQAVAFVIHELITNSIKHAWADQDENRKIELTYTEQEDTITLNYQDNGKGLPEDTDLSKSETLGLKLLHSFAKRQLRGSIDYSKGDKGGVSFVIRIKK